MKKNLVSIFSLGCLVASMSSATSFAQEAAAANTVLADNAVVSITSQVSSRYSLYNTTVPAHSSFFDQTARLGVNLSLGKVSGKVVGALKGNSLNTDGNITSQGKVGIREAWISYSLAKMTGKYEVSYEIGRFYPNSAMSYGADPTGNYWAGAGNFDTTDGMALNYHLTAGNMHLTAQGGISSALPVYIFTTTDTLYNGTNVYDALDSSFGGSTNENSIAYFGSLQFSANLPHDFSVEAAAAYGGKQKAHVGTDPNNSANTVQADLSYFEGSAGVHYKSMALGGWYSTSQISDAITYANATTSPFPQPASVTKNPDVTTSHQVIGVGLQGDSSIFDVQDLVAKGDAIVYGAGVQWISQRGFDNKLGATGVYADGSGNDSIMYSTGAGYQNGIFTATLNYVNVHASNNVFPEDGGSSVRGGSMDNNAYSVYIMTSLSL